MTDESMYSWVTGLKNWVAPIGHSLLDEVAGVARDYDEALRIAKEALNYIDESPVGDPYKIARAALDQIGRINEEV